MARVTGLGSDAKQLGNESHLIYSIPFDHPSDSPLADHV